MNSNFDDFIKQKLESIEEPFSEVEWQKFNAKLKATGNSTSSSGLSSNIVLTISALVIVGLGAIGFMLYNPTQTQKQETAIIKANTDEVAAEVSNVSSSEKTTQTEVIATTNAPNEVAQVNTAPKTETIQKAAVSNHTKTTAAPVGKSEPDSYRAPKKAENIQENVPPTASANLSNPTYKLNKTILCSGEALQLEIIDLGKGDKVVVTFSDGTEYTTASISKTFEAIDFYQFEAKIFNKNGENYATLINDKPIVIKASPDFEIIKTEINSEFKRPNYHFEVQSSSALNTIEWSIENKTIKNKSQIDHAFYSKGSYPVHVIAEASNGCKTQQTVQHQESEDYNLWAATSFSPNNDGVNDQWLPLALEDAAVTYTIEIRDRWNNVVFSGTDKDRQKWNGSVNGGLSATEGSVYSWIATVQFSNSEKETFKGRIIISNL